MNITNNAQAQVQATTGPNGEINVSIEQMVDSALASRMGPTGGRGLAGRMMRAQASKTYLRG